MIVEMEAEPGRDGTADHYGQPGSGTRTPAVPRWPCCQNAPQIEPTVPARVNGTWHWAHTAISKGHYPAHGPGGLIQG